VRISTVALENIRSHVKSQTNFVKGFNCLIGGLGTGKSSLLYAIDFAFFGDPLARSYNYLLRKGEEVGQVSVEFFLNGKKYRIRRGLKRHGKGISQDVDQLGFYEGENLIASMRKEAVAEQFTAITGLDKEIFRQIIWVRQEHLKELLDVAPRERQKRLDSLFGLSDYEVAWNNIRSIQRIYEVEKKTRQEDFDVLGIEKLEGDYHKAVEEFSSVEEEILDLTQGLHEAETRLQATSLQLQNLEDLRKKTEELVKKEASLQTHVANVEDMCARLADSIQRHTASIKELEQRLVDLEEQANLQRKELQNIGLTANLSIEDLRGQIVSFDDQMTSIKAELEAGSRDSKTSHQRITDLAEKSQCPLCLQPLENNYIDHMVKHFEEENTEREEKLREMQRNLLELGQLRNTANTALSKFQSFNPVIQDLRPRILDGENSKEKMEKEFGEQQLQEKMFRGQLEEVRKEISRFDISQLDLARKQHDDTRNKRHTIKIKLDYSEVRKKEVSIKIEDLRQRLENAQQKVTRVEGIGKMLETIEGIRNGYQSIQPKLRTEFVKILERTMQRVLDNLSGEEGTGLIVHIDDAYTPSIKSQEGYELEVTHLSGGERTLLAFAYRFALGQLIMQARTGHGLQMLLLDEPTESLGREDRSVDRLAEAIARLKAIEQIIAVTHNEAFAEKAENVIRLEKEIDVSRVVPEK